MLSLPFDPLRSIERRMTSVLAVEVARTVHARIALLAVAANLERSLWYPSRMKGITCTNCNNMVISGIIMSHGQRGEM